MGCLLKGPCYNGTTLYKRYQLQHRPVLFRYLGPFHKEVVISLPVKGIKHKDIFLILLKYRGDLGLVSYRDAQHCPLTRNATKSQKGGSKLYILPDFDKKIPVGVEI